VIQKYRAIAILNILLLMAFTAGIYLMLTNKPAEGACGIALAAFFQGLVIERRIVQ
jgi:hypothetical protein